jgi:lysophospholipase L1-like esterase
MHYQTLLKSLLPLLALTSAAVHAEDSQYLMGIVGDSISAGTFADSRVKTPEGNEEPSPLDNTQPRVPFLGNKENKETLSWASGRELESHGRRLEKNFQNQEGAKLVVRNVSVPGEKAKDLVAQIEELAKAMSENQYKGMPYVTLLIGANDACEYTELDSFKKSLKEAFARLAEITPETRIAVLVSAIPKIPELGRPEILRMRGGGNFSCKTLRDGILRFCTRLTKWETEEEFNEGVEVVKAFNSALQEEALAATAAHPNLDVRFDDSFYREPIRPSDLAADCFHPNADAHSRLSETLWKAQPWFQ